VSKLVLRPLTAADEHAARAAHAELAADGFEFLLELRADQPWAAYIHRLDRLSSGLDVPVDRVPATFLIAEVGGEIVGRSSVRHTLNPYLARIGGHVGYGIRPRARRRGYATEVLHQSLDLLRGLGVERALITCDDENGGSATVIERCGGTLQDVLDDDGGPQAPVLDQHHAGVTAAHHQQPARFTGCCLRSGRGPAPEGQWGPSGSVRRRQPIRFGFAKRPAVPSSTAVEWWSSSPRSASDWAPCSAAAEDSSSRIPRDASAPKQWR